MGVTGSHRRGRILGSRFRRGVAMSAGLALVASLVTALPALADPATGEPPHPVQADPPSVPGGTVPVLDYHPEPVPGAVLVPDDAPAASNQVDGAAVDVPGPAGVVDWPEAGQAEVVVPAGGLARVGDLPVRVGRPAGGNGVVPGAVSVPDRVRVELLGREATEAAGVDGLLFRIGTPSSGARGGESGRVVLDVDYSGFRRGFGADWSSRLRLVRVPVCALTTPRSAHCQERAPLVSTNDAVDGHVSADVPADGGVVALVAAPSGAAGDYTATQLSPSASWQVSTQTGGFSWSYPIRVPPVPGGLTPTVSLDYSSQGVDGRTAATNNQASWVGEGWSLWPGYVERSYKACADDTSPKTGDQCWGTDNATLVLNGRATALIKDSATGEWHARDDDGSRVEHLTGGGNADNDKEYWRVTDTDGTQYYFGLTRLPGWTSGDPNTRSAWTMPVFGDDPGEPCHAATFAASWCKQAWRWNLDYVVDPHGDAMAYYYTPQRNFYGRNLNQAATAYTRGGTIDRIEYGLRSDAVYSTPAVGRVEFGVANRCEAGSACTSSAPQDWPDVPWDQNCGGGSCPDQLAPTFWSTKRLASITTQIRSGSTYQDVESWNLRHSFPPPGDGTDATVWLEGIAHTGLVGTSVSVPDVEFTGEALPNRVDGLEGLPPLYKYRMLSISSETGGVIGIKYSDPGCSRSALPAPESNTTRCFPTYWTPEDEQNQLDWFHKYVVDQVEQVDTTGGSPFEVTSYEYVGGAAWHYDDNELAPDDRRTWSQWRGYSRVKVRHGDPTLTTPSVSEYLYFRGMDGDTLPNGGTRHASVTDSEGTVSTDSDQLRGFLREEVHYNGSAVLTGTINTPWSFGPTATRDDLDAFIVQTRKVRTRTALSTGGFRRTEVDTAFNDQGIPTSTSDLGDIATSTDDRCARYTYARDTSAWMLTYPSRVETTAVNCAGTPTFPHDAISDTRTSYDGGSFGAAPTHGDVTKTEELNTHPASGPTYVRTYRGTFDQYGRPLDSFDALDHETTATYTPAVGGPVTSVTTTNPLGHTNTTTLEPAWGLPVKQVDANNKTTELIYDAMGRLTDVWLPGARGHLPQPNLQFSYLIRKNGPVVVATKKVNPNSAYLTSYTLYDSRLRPRQTQTPAPGGGRLLTDTFYDSRGLVVKAYGSYYNDDPPTNSLLAVADNVVPTQTVASYDNAERPVASIFRIRGVEQWRTTTTYGGDRVSVNPPDGATATTTISDARGNTTELRQYHGGSPTGAFDATTYTHTPAGQLDTLTDPAGNTWTYTYDLRGRRTQSDDPDKGISTSTYNDLGQVLTSTDSRGETLAYSYDSLGRKTEVREDSATGPVRSEWTYDTLAKGHLTSSTRHEDGADYTAQVTGYSDRYQPTGTTITIPTSEGALAGTYHTDTTYRLNGTVHTTTLPAAGGLPNETLTYAYNSVGLPNLFRGISTYVTQSMYTKFGEPLQYELDTGNFRTVWLSYFYEEGTRRLSEATTIQRSGVATQKDVHYTYDPAGNVTKIADTPPSLPADVQCFDYDYLRRLTQAWASTNDCATEPTNSVIGGPAPYWTSYTYDTTGNRLTQTDHDSAGDTTHTYTYPDPGQPHPHALQSVTTSGPGGTSIDTYAYDDAGNTTSRDIAGDTQTLEWGTEGHLESTTSPSGDTSYVYNTEGGRLIRHDDSGATLYLGAMEVHADNAGNVTATRYYTHNGITIALRTPQGLNWLGTDHHSTPDLASTTTTQADTRRYFTPFGAPRGPQTTWPDDHGFLNAPTDPTGLTHLGAREYDPVIGRFISVDPLLSTQNPQQLNGYTYANNNPITFADPTGELICKMPDGYDCGRGGAYDRSGNYNPNRRSLGVKKSVARPNGTYQKTLHTLVNGYLLPAHAPADIDEFIRTADSLIPDMGFGDISTPELLAKTCQYLDYGYCDDDFHLALENDAYLATQYLWCGDNSLCQEALGLAPALAGSTRGPSSIARAGARRGPTAITGMGGTRFLGRIVCNSFTPNTAVLLADGTHKAIKDIKLGDRILVTDPDAGGTNVSRVVGTITGHGDKHLIRITVSDGTGEETTLTTTDTHPFQVDDNPRLLGPNIPAGHWTIARQLQPGDTLHAPNGEPLTISEVTDYTAHQTVYNLTIDGTHTYYIVAGTTAALVHNCGESLPGLTTSRGQIESKFKHAGDFGVSEPRGTNGFNAFEGALRSFVGDQSTIRREGTFRGDSVILNYSPESSLVVVQSPDGAFVSGWKMLPGQLENVATRGSL